MSDTKSETAVVRSKVAELKAQSAAQHAQAIVIAKAALEQALKNTDSLTQLAPPGRTRLRGVRVPGAGARLEGPLTDDERES